MNYHRELLGSMLFNVLRLFEEHKNYKMYHEVKGSKTDLVEISENLKAEPIIMNGWIDQYSRYFNKNKQSNK